MLSIQRIRDARDGKGQRGQAMAEFVIWVFVLLAMIEGILWFGKAYELKLTCHMAARYMATATASVAETDLEDSQIMSRAQAYYPMTDHNPTYVELAPFDPAANPSSANSSFPSSGPLNMASSLSNMLSFASQTRGFEVGATYAPNSILDNTLPGGTHVRSRHFVSGGTWHKKQTYGDLQIMAVKGALMAWSAVALSSY
ncbi:MAG: pilus assembly protein [Deltaproteobacteria bacterium]|nr:pilus assembly protein [Deltaproteobacteria bacterium]